MSNLCKLGGKIMEKRYNEVTEERIEQDEEKIVKGNFAKPISVATVPPTAYGVGDIDDDYE